MCNKALLDTLNKVSDALGLHDYWIDIGYLPDEVVAGILDVLVAHAKKTGKWNNEQPR